MGKIKDNYKELQLEFLKTVQPSSFLKIICVSEVKYNKINWTAMTKSI